MRKLYFLLLIFVLTACGTEGNLSSEISTGNKNALPPAESEVKEGDFIYRLFSEKDVYDKFGETAIFGELTYVGEFDSIDIYHAASPFSFPIEERTRGIEVDYAMNQPLIITTLKKGEPLLQKYSFAGGYSDNDDEKYVEFIKSLIKDGFDEGEYVIHGSADFYTVDPAKATTEQKYYLKTDIGFSVRKNVNE